MMLMNRMILKAENYKRKQINKRYAKMITERHLLETLWESELLYVD